MNEIQWINKDKYSQKELIKASEVSKEQMNILAASVNKRADDAEIAAELIVAVSPKLTG